MTPEQAKALREPFPASAIGKLPKGGMLLDYCGHAAVTDRLLTVDPGWSWEPMAYAPDGGPLVRVVNKDAELWIRLTVCGITRIGVGTAPSGAMDLGKQLVSDALRNAAMRFGVALDLWSKEDLLAAEANERPTPAPKPAAAKPGPPAALVEQCKTLADELTGVHADAWTEWKAEHPGWHKTEAGLSDARAELLELNGLMHTLAGDEPFADDTPPSSGGPADPPVLPRAGRRTTTKEKP